MNPKTIGVIGGVGPLATVAFENTLLSLVDAKSDQDYPTIITINNGQIPDRTAALLKNGPSPTPEILETATKLIAAGAETLCIPCNTAHAFYDELAEALPEGMLVNMVEEVGRTLDEKYKELKTVGVLCTDGTRNARVYDNELTKHGRDVLYPPAESQAGVMNAIYQIKSGEITQPTIKLRRIVDELIRNGAEAIVLGCTELPLAIDRADVPLIDSTEILARAVLKHATKKEA